MGSPADDEKFRMGNHAVHFFSEPYGGEGVVFSADDESGNLNVFEHIFC